MKRIFKIDLLLYLLGPATAVSGFVFHVAGHGGNVHHWVVWAWIHTTFALLMTVTMVLHLVTHKAWLKGLKSGVQRRRRRMTFLLGVLALAMVVSGVLLLGIDGANTPVGLWHYRLGIFFVLLSFGHAARRFRIFRNALRKGKNTPRKG